MKYLRLYEDFIELQIQDEIETEVELSDKTIDDVLSDDFFKDENDETKDDVVYQIKNWKVY
jgi:hypothetical protein